MTEIILVRHGQIDHNTDGRYCGWTNPGLNSIGRYQAIELKEKLKDEPIEYIYTSDLMRCVETATIINEYHNIEICKDKKLREINFGIFEDKTYKEISRLYPNHRKNWIEQGIEFKMPEGENIDMMIERTIEVIDDIKKSHHKKVLLVAHSGVIRGILSKFISGNIESYWKYKIDNCGITKIEVTDSFTVLTCMNK